MPFTGINIAQNNITGDSNLMAVHSPLVFLVNIEFSGTAPEHLYVKIYDSDDTLLGTFKGVPYRDLLATIRQFYFKADSILRGLMESFSDEVQSANSLENIENATKFFKLVFSTYETVQTYYFSDEVEIIALHASRQFGDDPGLTDIYDNNTKIFYTGEGKPVYLYVYNDDEANTITALSGETEYEACLDYDDEEFTDAVDEIFTAIFA